MTQTSVERNRGNVRYLTLKTERNHLSGRLALVASQRMLIYVTESMDEPIGGVCQFTENEWAVLLPILADYPFHAPYDRLLAAYRVHGAITPEAIATAMKDIVAGNAGTEFKMVKNLVSAARLKVHTLDAGVTIKNTYEAGYTLTPQEQEGRKETC